MSYSVDANLLLYASDSSSSFHEKARAFIESIPTRHEILGLAWTTAMAYLRIATHPSIFARPLAPRDAMENLESLMNLPRVRMIDEGEEFWPNYHELATRGVPRGNAVPDTHLAAILRQNGIKTLYTNDDGFRRFGFLDVRNPFES